MSNANPRRVPYVGRWARTGAVLGLMFAWAMVGRAGAQQDPSESAPEWSAAPLGLDLHFPVPESNRLTDAKIELGRRLFFDPVLSVDRRVACASCHRPERAFADSVSLSRGARGAIAKRNTPSILNRAYGRAFFLDGRASSLESTVLQPIRNPFEMALPLEEAVARLSANPEYRKEFDDAFAEVPTSDNLARALASYVRTLRSGDAPVDRFRLGDPSALSEEATAGWRLFIGRGNCVACHTGPTLSDERFHTTGVTVESGDVGREGVTGSPGDRGAFKTPSLRNVARTAPYMHDGSLASLEAVVDFYDRGGNPNANLDSEIRPLGLSEVEKKQLVVFLNALTGTW